MRIPEMIIKKQKDNYRLDNAVKEFMKGSGLTLKELAKKHDVSHFWLQIEITEKIKQNKWLQDQRAKLLK